VSEVPVFEIPMLKDDGRKGHLSGKWLVAPQWGMANVVIAWPLQSCIPAINLHHGHPTMMDGSFVVLVRNFMS